MNSKKKIAYDFPLSLWLEYQPPFKKMKSKKKITYKPICWKCGSRRNLTKYHAQGGEYHLCKKHAPAWMKRTKRAESKKP